MVWLFIIIWSTVIVLLACAVIYIFNRLDIAFVFSVGSQGQGCIWVPFFFYKKTHFEGAANNHFSKLTPSPGSQRRNHKSGTYIQVIYRTVQ